MLIVRPATSVDFDALVRLAKLAGPGFTSLAVGAHILKMRLEKSVDSFAGPRAISPDHTYLLMLEDTDTGQVHGLSAVKAQIGLRDPFFNFRILKIAQKSEVTNRRFDMDVLLLVNEYAGATEVGSLFLTIGMRGTGAGRLISQARYFLMAADPDRFADLVISELRGHVDEKGRSPFWEAVGRKFFLMDFSEADHISAQKDHQFILDLMPKYPIYAALLPQEAQDVMGKPHPAGVGARRYLEAEGFRYNGVIDIFDAGPSVSAPKADIRTIRDSCPVKLSGHMPVNFDEADPPILTGLLSNNRIRDFRCVLQRFQLDNGHVRLTSETIDALRVGTGDTIRLWIKP
ncbi:MAG: arginine N-succinyltransferase [Hyphomonadaceae bacterium]|nr:arginine N-succinyltransferase [Hyphomonadaceae bacterium]MBC6411706.1 arginine N-succinyltransferase [Hyphomonadaceae bacterium]